MQRKGKHFIKYSAHLQCSVQDTALKLRNAQSKDRVEKNPTTLFQGKGWRALWDSRSSILNYDCSQNYFKRPLCLTTFCTGDCF